MKLEGILSISGKPGLYKLVSQAKNSVIVESLSDKKRFPIHATDQVSAIEEIGIYTYGDTVSLSDVFEAIALENKGQACISHKASKDELAIWLRGLLPEYDEEQVYYSNIKKIAQWYNILQENGLVEVPQEKETNQKAEETPKKQ